MVNNSKAKGTSEVSAMEMVGSEEIKHGLTSHNDRTLTVNKAPVQTSVRGELIVNSLELVVNSTLGG